MAHKATDILVVGAGIAGAGIATFLAQHTDVIMIEAEDNPAYHTTGRSAAFFAETYGGPIVQPLSTASRDFLLNPPDYMAVGPVLTPRGAIHVFNAGQRQAADLAFNDMKIVNGTKMLDKAAAIALAPDLKGGSTIGAISDPQCGDLDVAKLHQGYLGAAKRLGADIYLQSPALKIEKQTTGFRVSTSDQLFTANKIVNAAGAWADRVAAFAGLAPIGLVPKRRTIITTGPLHGSTIKLGQPVVLDVVEECYFRPEGDGYLISPADQTPDIPRDVQPEEEDIALAAWRFEQLTGLNIKRLKSKWAGLRTFAPDKQPVIGEDPRLQGFYWSAGQGGWGIQTSPAWSAVLARQILEDAGLFPKIEQVAPSPFRPDRLL